MHTLRALCVPLAPFASMAAKTRLSGPGARSRATSSTSCHDRSPRSDGSGAPTGTTQYPVPSPAKRSPTVCVVGVACPVTVMPSVPGRTTMPGKLTSVTCGSIPAPASTALPPSAEDGAAMPGSAPAMNWPDSTCTGSVRLALPETCWLVHATVPSAASDAAMATRGACITSPPGGEAPTGHCADRSGRRARRGPRGRRCGRTRTRDAHGWGAPRRRAAKRS